MSKCQGRNLLLQNSQKVVTKLIKIWGSESSKIPIYFLYHILITYFSFKNHWLQSDIYAKYLNTDSSQVTHLLLLPFGGEQSLLPQTDRLRECVGGSRWVCKHEMHWGILSAKKSHL